MNSAFAQTPVALPASAAASTHATAKAPAQLPLRRDTSEIDSAVGPAAWLILILVLAGTWLFFLARRRRASPDRQGWRAWLRPMAGEASTVTVLSRQQLTPQSSVHVLRWRDEELLVGCTPQSVTLLARRPAEPGGQAGSAGQTGQQEPG